MSAHWRLAVRGAAFMVALAVPVGVAILYVYGESHALSFLYGVGTGIMSYASTALTVSLMVGRSKAGGLMIGASSFVVRFGFAAVALGVPAYLELWPVVPMLGGFAGVYLAENVVLLPGVMRATRNARPGGAGRSVARDWNGG
jgi:hypothetical protein